MVADRGLGWVKYANFASPVAAGWLAAKTIEVNLFMGVLLSSYLVLWVFANGAGLLVILLAHVSAVRRSNPARHEDAPPDDG